MSFMFQCINIELELHLRQYKFSKIAQKRRPEKICTHFCLQTNLNLLLFLLSTNSIVFTARILTKEQLKLITSFTPKRSEMWLCCPLCRNLSRTSGTTTRTNHKPPVYNLPNTTPT